MGCGTIHNTPNSTIRLSQNLIYVTNISENKKNKRKENHEMSQKSLQNKKNQDKYRVQTIKTQNKQKTVNCKLISLNDLKFKNKQKKVRFRGSLQVQNLDIIQNKQNLFSNNIFRNQNLLSQQRKLKKVTYNCKLNKSNKKLITQESYQPLTKSHLQGLYKNRVVVTQTADINDLMSKNVNAIYKTNLKQEITLPKIAKQSLPLEPNNICNKVEHKRNSIQKFQILKIPFIEDQVQNINQSYHFSLSNNREKTLSRGTFNQKILTKERNSNKNNYRSIESSFYFPDIDSIPNQRLFQKSKTTLMKSNQNRNQNQK